MNTDRYRVGGRGKALPLKEALAKADRLHRRTGIIAGVEQVEKGRKK